MKIVSYFAVIGLILQFSILSVFGEVAVEKVSFYSSDGVKLMGVYHPPKNSDGEVFILLHALGTNKEEWNYFETKLDEAGYGFLAYDARGHGESTYKKDGKTINFEQFGRSASPNSQWNKMVGDLASSVAFLISNKQLKRQQIGLIGASVGANISLIYGSSYNHVGTLVLLSPGLSYVGLDTLDYIKAYKKGKIAIAAAPSDDYAFKSSRILYKKIKSNPKAEFIEGESGHGVKMFDGEVDKLLIDWLGK